MAGYDSGCRGKAWIGGAGAGLAVFFWVLAVAGFGFGAAVFLGVLTFLFLGAVLVWAFCTGADLTFEEAPQGFEVPDIPAPIVPVPEVAPVAAPMPVAAPVAPAEPPEVVAEDVVSAATASLAEAAPVEEAPVAETPVADPAPEDAAAEAERKAARMARRKAKAEAAEAAAAEAAGAEAAGAVETDPALEAERKAARAARRKARFEAQARAEAEAAAPAESEPAEPSGTKPAGLAAPRGGRADELRLIEGVGPKLEEVLHGWGIFHFDQIAGWGPAEVAFADSQVPRFKGRCSRDKWVAQAKIIVEEGVDAFLERAKTNDY